MARYDFETEGLEALEGALEEANQSLAALEGALDDMGEDEVVEGYEDVAETDPDTGAIRRRRKGQTRQQRNTRKHRKANDEVRKLQKQIDEIKSQLAARKKVGRAAMAGKGMLSGSVDATSGGTGNLTVASVKGAVKIGWLVFRSAAPGYFSAIKHGGDNLDVGNNTPAVVMTGNDCVVLDVSGLDLTIDGSTTTITATWNNQGSATARGSIEVYSSKPSFVK